MSPPNDPPTDPQSGHPPADPSGTVAAVVDLARQVGPAIASPDASALALAEEFGTAVHDEGAPLQVRAELPQDGMGELSVTRRWDSETPNAATIQLEPAAPLAAFEELLGTGRPLPTTAGGGRRVLFPGGPGGADTSPEDGDPGGEPAGGSGDGWTLLADLADDDHVAALIVRRD